MDQRGLPMPKSGGNTAFPLVAIAIGITFLVVMMAKDDDDDEDDDDDASWWASASWWPRRSSVRALADYGSAIALDILPPQPQTANEPIQPGPPSQGPASGVAIYNEEKCDGPPTRAVADAGEAEIRPATRAVADATIGTVGSGGGGAAPVAAVRAKLLELSGRVVRRTLKRDYDPDTDCCICRECEADVPLTCTRHRTCAQCILQEFAAVLDRPGQETRCPLCRLHVDAPAVIASITALQNCKNVRFAHAQRSLCP